MADLDYNTEADGAYATPAYADLDSIPVSNPHCDDEDSNPNSIILDPATSSGGRETEVTAGTRISVDDLSGIAKDIYRVNYVAYTPLVLTMLAKGYIADVLQSEPVLKGSTIDKIIIDWTKNKAVISQALTNNGGLTPPTLNITVETYEYTGLTITDDIQFTLSDDDGAFETESVQIINDSLIFGNHRIWGDALTAEGIGIAAMQILLDTFNKDISNTKNKTVAATGGANNHFFYAYPKSLGEATFKKGIFEGGFIRLKVVLGIFKLDLIGGDVEQEFIYDNGNGFTEAYYIYMSTFDNQNDPITPIVIT